MDQFIAALTGGGSVLIVALLLGGGLPALFALGIKALAWSNGLSTKPGLSVTHPVGKLYAALLFSVIGLAIAFGLTYLIVHGLGYSVVFNGLIPTIKK